MASASFTRKKLLPSRIPGLTLDQAPRRDCRESTRHVLAPPDARFSGSAVHGVCLCASRRTLRQVPVRGWIASLSSTGFLGEQILNPFSSRLRPDTVERTSGFYHIVRKYDQIVLGSLVPSRLTLVCLIPMDRPLRVAVVGAGWSLESRFLPGWSCRDVQCAAVCDLQPDRGQSACGPLSGGKSFSGSGGIASGSQVLTSWM